MWGHGTGIDMEKWNRDRCGKMEQRWMWGNGPEIDVEK
jgi:hypothetical protein